MLNINYGFRRHCGGLKESLLTTHYLTREQFAKLLREYTYYGYDERCNQFLFILRDMDKKFNCFLTKNYEEYINRSWLFIEVEL